MKLKVPAASGIPYISPVVWFRFSPPGRLPLNSSQVIEGWPVAVRVCEYAASTVPFGSGVSVVMVGALSVVCVSGSELPECSVVDVSA